MESFIQLTKETLDDSYRDFLSKKTCSVGTAKKFTHEESNRIVNPPFFCMAGLYC